MDPRTPVDELERLSYELKRIKDRLDELQAPSGTMAYQSVAKLQALVENIQEQLNDFIANDSYTKAQINAKIASPGDISPDDITATGSLSVAGIVSSPGSRANPISTFRTVVWREDGSDMGYSSSTRRVKQDIEDAAIALDAFMAVKPRRFRYISEVEADPDARTDLGFIAEELVEAGFTEPVFTDVDGVPEGVNYDRLTPILWGALQAALIRIDKLERGAS